MKKVTAIIPARGGSKGIPQKNLKSFLGAPLVSHSIKAAQAAKLVCNVLVTSDDDEILSVAARYGAETVRRPEELSQDTSPSEEALIHAIQSSEAARGSDVIVFLQCTSPLTSPVEIDLVVQALLDEQADVAVGVIEVHVFLWEIAEDGAGVSINHNHLEPRQRRQDRPRQFRETGAVYALDKAGFLENKSRFFGRVVPVPLPDGVNLDLDTTVDWAVMEAFAKAHNLQNCG